MTDYPHYPDPPRWSYGQFSRLLTSMAVQTMASGKELLADFWLGRFKRELTLNYQGLSQSEVDILEGFFLAYRGVPFLLDYRADPQSFGVTGAVLGTANGSQDTFQLVRPLGTYYNESCKFIHNAPNVYVGSSLIDPAYYTVNANGQVVFAPGHIPVSGQVKADFSFDYLMRFAMEGKGGASNAAANAAALEFEYFSYQLQRLGQVTLVTWFE